MSSYYYRFPYSFYNNRYNPYYYKNSYCSDEITSSFEQSHFSNININKKTSSKMNENIQNLHNTPIVKNNSKKIFDFDDKNQKPIFEFLGIQLFFDDILLICLIFFLYTEGVQDQYLFIALILLLLS